MRNKYIFRDAFNMLCGDKIGSGAYRDVYECKLRPEFVVKVEQECSNGYRTFHNVMEMQFWDDNQHYNAVAKWLSPCEFLSPDGHILLMKRAKPLNSWKDIPKSLPSFITDIKETNFGILNGKIVLVDYALTISNPSLKLRKNGLDK